MLARTFTAALGATLLAASAGLAHAQGSVTQDPGRISPGNLTFQHLGPAGAALEREGTNAATPESGRTGRGTTARIPQSGSGSARPGARPNSGLGGNTAGGR